MFGYKRTYAGKRRGFYSYGRSFGKYSRRGTVGRAAAGAAAAKRSDKTEVYSCTVNGVCTSTLPARQQMTRIKVFHPYMGGLMGDGIPNDNDNLVLGGAINDRGYRMKCACYDEVKLDSMRVTITPAQIMANATAVTYTVCTMWDRKANPKECGYLGAAEWMTNGSMPTAMEIYNNEGTIKSIITNNQIYGYKRYCRASSIMEKGGYHDSSILYNGTADQSPLLYMYQDSWLRHALPFSPGLFMTIYCPLTFQNDTVIPLSYKVEYTFSFRNPKSDLDWFLVVESPGYVNPDVPEGDVSDPNRSLVMSRRTPKELNDEFRAIYELKHVSTLPLGEAKTAIESLFSKPKDEDEDGKEQKAMDVEDDPGTS